MTSLPIKKGLALIIEDDDDLARIFGEAVRRAGFDIEVLKQGDLAMKRLGEVIPKIIVLDLHLPRVTGGEIMDYITINPRFKDTRVIIATADAILADNYRSTADLVLIKPISYNQLKDLATRLD